MFSSGREAPPPTAVQGPKRVLLPMPALRSEAAADGVTTPCSSLVTPEVKSRNITTPPSFRPASFFHQELQEDLERALKQGSLQQVEVALGCRHCSAGAHSVFEAVLCQHLGALEFLLRRGARGVDEPCRGRRPLHVALQACAVQEDVGYQMARLLLQHGARPDFREGDLRSEPAPLHGAAQRCNLALADLLLSHGADPNCVDAGGLTPLHAACRWQALPLVDGQQQRLIGLLLRRGACPLKPDAAGLLPAQHAWDPELNRLLTGAEQQWSGRMFAVACGCPAAHGPGSCSAVTRCWKLPEVVEAISSFICQIEPSNRN